MISNFISPAETGRKENCKVGDSSEELADKDPGKAKDAKPSPKKKSRKRINSGPKRKRNKKGKRSHPPHQMFQVMPPQPIQLIIKDSR